MVGRSKQLPFNSLMVLAALMALMVPHILGPKDTITSVRCQGLFTLL